MTITWYGLGSFKITGKDITIITDPFTGKTGLSPVRGGADVVILTNPALDWASNTSGITGTPFVIDGPGEYDIKGAFIQGVAAENRDLGPNTVYSITLEDIRIAFLGPINQPELTDEQKQAFEGCDIALVPVGGKQVLDAQTAAKIATKMEPYYIIPHTYKIPGLEMPYEKLDAFTKEVGKATESDKITVKKKDFTTETTSVIALQPQR